MKVFVDTSAWFSLFDKNDKFHKSTLTFLRTKPDLVTSDVVFIETCALLHKRLGKRVCQKAGDFLRKSNVIELLRISDEELGNAWEEFKRITYSKISFVDVTNKIIMQNLGISEIFAFDKDFEKLGLRVVPD